jgi:CHAD domain-containing protein
MLRAIRAPLRGRCVAQDVPPRERSCCRASKGCFNGGMARRATEPANPARRWLRELEAALRQVHLRGDPRSIHQLRVCLARLRVWLWLGKHRALADEARWLRRLAGPLRDLDVQRAISRGPEAGDRRSAAQRRTAWKTLCRHLDEDRARAFRRALEEIEPPRRKRAQKRLRRLLLRTLERAERLEGHWDEADHLHALRQAVRRVRYGMECMGLDVDAVAALQEALGAAHDLSLAAARGGGAGIERKLAAAQARARESWPKARRALEHTGSK